MSKIVFKTPSRPTPEPTVDDDALTRLQDVNPVDRDVSEIVSGMTFGEVAEKVKKINKGAEAKLRKKAKKDKEKDKLKEKAK